MDIRRAAEALRDGVRAGRRDLDHPEFRQLEALVHRVLDDVEREIVSSHLEVCAQCAEDVADLQDIRFALEPPVVARPPRRHRAAAAAAAIAASLAAVIWLGRPPAVAPAPVTPVVGAPTAPPTRQDPLTATERSAIDAVLAAGRLDIPAFLSDLQGQQGTLLGDTASAVIIGVAPVGTAVASARPAFQWRPVTGAISYSIAVFDARFQEVARVSRITATRWTPQADLPRDQMLAWQVTAHLAGSDIVGPAPPQPEARFRIVDVATADRTREQAARLADRPLDLAILLARVGLIDNARRQLEQAQTNPATFAAARRLMATLTKR